MELLLLPELRLPPEELLRLLELELLLAELPDELLEELLEELRL